jgi:hypothetical protein
MKSPNRPAPDAISMISPMRLVPGHATIGT